MNRNAHAQPQKGQQNKHKQKTKFALLQCTVMILSHSAEATPIARHLIKKSNIDPCMCPYTYSCRPQAKTQDRHKKLVI